MDELTDFNLRSKKEKEYIIFESGKAFLLCVDNSLTDEHQALYSLGKFFVEVIADKSSLRIKDISAFKSGFLLEKYALILKENFTI